MPGPQAFVKKVEARPPKTDWALTAHRTVRCKSDGFWCEFKKLEYIA
jgi:hypothetical protein